MTYNDSYPTIIMMTFSSGIGEDESQRTALATIDSAVTAPPPNLDQEVDMSLMMTGITYLTMFRLISCSMVVE